MEAVAMILALVFVFAVVVAKVMTTQLVGHMNRQISQVASIKQEALNRLKTAQSQKMVVEKNKAILDKKKNKTAKSIGRLKKEMAGFKEEEAARRSKIEARKIG
jgi:hypothetical protein